MVGNFATDAVSMVERWSFVGPDTIDYRVRIEDANARPLSIQARLMREKTSAGGAK